MSPRRPAAAPPSPDRWAAQVAALEEPRARPAPRKEPITVDRIVEVAFGIVEEEGYDALTMRRVAAALDTGPASLYAHVRGKADLDGLLIGALAAGVTLPRPDRRRWRSQVRDVCRQLRDQYLRYPGISRAALGTSQTSLDAVRVHEGMLAILLAGGVAPESAAWAIDALLLYVAAYSFEASLRARPGQDIDQRVLDRAEIRDRLSKLPASRFPNTVAYARELTSGQGHQRFDFTVDLVLGGLSPSSR